MDKTHRSLETLEAARQQLAEKTYELQLANEAMEKEIHERRWAEAALQMANDQLEAIVEERTNELQAVNKKLNRELKERRILESQLVQAQKMESIGQLAAGVAHEINNPVGFVMSNLSTLSDYVGLFKKILTHYESLTYMLKEKGSQEILESLSEIETLCEQEDLPFVLDDVEGLLKESSEGTMRVKEIVQSLKSFARLDEADSKEVNIHDCLESTLKVVWNELKYKCTVVKQYGEIPELFCNPSQLNQVFMNLLVNAAQAITDHGVITLETLATETQVKIKISDTGSGIPADKISHIFDPFFTTKSVGKGTGLGLSISYGIVEKHRGTIEVESEVGRGTTFTISLPKTTEGGHA